MRIGLVAALVLAAATACAGDERLSRAEYTSRANAICARYDRQLEDVERELERTESGEEVARALDRGIPIVEEGLEALRELEPPEELEDDVERWLELNEENATSLEELRDAARAEDAQRVREIATRGEERERRSDALVREIGVDECAAGG